MSALVDLPRRRNPRQAMAREESTAPPGRLRNYLAAGLLLIVFVLSLSYSSTAEEKLSRPETVQEMKMVISEEHLPKNVPEQSAANNSAPSSSEDHAASSSFLSDHDCSVETKNSVEANYTLYPSEHLLINLVDFSDQSYAPAALASGGSQIICELHKGIEPFRLVMQQLTRCFALWQSFPASERVLVTGKEVPVTQSDTGSIVQLLQEVFAVKVVQTLDQTKRLESVIGRPAFLEKEHEYPLFEGFAMSQPQQADLFRRQILEHLGLVARADCSSSMESPPRVAIVDHSQTPPRLNNLSQLKEKLETIPAVSVRVISLEDISFLEQMALLSQVDILIAPHSDVLTSAMFMPPCSALVEIFPRGYFYPELYATLSAMAGLNYASIYTGTNVVKEWYTQKKTRLRRNKDSDICAPLHATVAAVRELTTRLKSCCHERAISVPNVSSIPPLEISSVNGCLSIGKPIAVTTNYPVNRTMDNIVTVLQSENHTDTMKPRHAVCTFVHELYWEHFPHGIQQLYRCFSFWHSYPDHQHLLLFTEKLTSRQVFFWEMRRLFKKMLGVREIGNRTKIPPGSLVVQPNHYQLARDHPYSGIAMQNPEHAHYFRHKTQEYFNLTVTNRCQPGKSPRIAILNRQPKSRRAILNLVEVCEHLAKATGGEIEVYYFEGKSFKEQLQIMSNVDILVSPHGAQLTSINFMPRCGAVLEVSR